jgi:hypothetical protein
VPGELDPLPAHGAQLHVDAAARLDADGTGGGERGGGVEAHVLRDRPASRAQHQLHVAEVVVGGEAHGGHVVADVRVEQGLVARQDGDTVLVKASRGVGLEVVADALQQTA